MKHGGKQVQGCGWHSIPISITAISGEMLARQDITSLTNLEKVAARSFGLAAAHPSRADVSKRDWSMRVTLFEATGDRGLVQMRQLPGSWLLGL